METSKRALPFAHAVTEGAFDPQLVAQAAADWPGPGWPEWVRYDTPLERKRACNLWDRMPRPCALLLARLLQLPVWELLGQDRDPLLLADGSLYGGGLHDMGAGDHLDCHLDADRHPRFGLQRRYNAILFLGACPGGELELWDAGRREAVAIRPAAGRLVAFEAGDQSYHSVARVYGPRKSLAAYWWGTPRGGGKRPRATFLARPGEAPDPEKDRLRGERGH